MPCFGPLVGFLGAELTAKGKRRIVFDVRLAHSPRPIPKPCGQCVGCRLEVSRQWAMRCVHEQKLHRSNCFITLTYDDEHLPEGGTLVKRDLQLFFKRLRKKFGSGIRFYACGEYGDVSRRPHYHAIVFNHDFVDRKIFSNRQSKPVFTSAELSAVWPMGLAVVGDVSFESAAYVARYVLKKVTGKRADDHYSRFDAEGRIYRVAPEFVQMSRRPGIGLNWFREFGKQAFLLDAVVIRGHEVRPPRYYETKYEVDQPAHLFYLKRARREKARALAEDAPQKGVHGRLHVKERVAVAALKQKGRKL